MYTMIASIAYGSCGLWAVAVGSVFVWVSSLDVVDRILNGGQADHSVLGFRFQTQMTYISSFTGAVDALAELLR